MAREYTRAKRSWPTVTISWPGLIGALSGMNEHGLALTNMEVTRDGATAPRAMPYTLLYRTLLERCKTVDEAIAELRKVRNDRTLGDITIRDLIEDGRRW